MKNKMKQLLSELNAFAREINVQAEFWLHAEKSSLTRFANSEISLNTSEDIISLTITAYRGNSRGTYSLVTNLEEKDKMKTAIKTADEIAEQSSPVNYNLTFIPLPENEDDDKNFDEKLFSLTQAEKLNYVNKAVEGLESEQITLSGIFSSGAIFQATANTLSDVILFHSVSDAQVSLVLSHSEDKWEVAAGQSAASLEDLQPEKVHEELEILLNLHLENKPQPVSLGKYDIVFGSDAFAELLGFFSYIGFDGDSFKRQQTFLKEKHLNQKIFSENLTIKDNPAMRETFPYRFDMNGIPRKTFPLIENGIFKSFIWERDAADEFGEKETGHSVPAMSIVVDPGGKEINSLAELLKMPRDKDILFFPHIHYMNVVNPTEGIITGSSRFGALILRKSGEVEIPQNLRITDSLLNLFANVEWLSKERAAANTSNSYGKRNPKALYLPKFVKINNVEITHVTEL